MQNYVLSPIVNYFDKSTTTIINEICKIPKHILESELYDLETISQPVWLGGKIVHFLGDFWDLTDFKLIICLLSTYEMPQQLEEEKRMQANIQTLWKSDEQEWLNLSILRLFLFQWLSLLQL